MGEHYVYLHVRVDKKLVVSLEKDLDDDHSLISTRDLYEGGIWLLDYLKGGCLRKLIKRGKKHPWIERIPLYIYRTDPLFLYVSPPPWAIL